MSPVAPALSALRVAFGDDRIATGAAISPKHHSDMSAVNDGMRCAPAAVFRPRTIAEVPQALAICHAHGLPVVAQGGLTGLAGGATPSPGALAISLDLLRGIEEIDPAAATITVKAGTPLEEVQQAAREAGFFLGLDLGSRGTCQIGGNLSTNAGGIRVIRYGMAREQVLGLEAVLADGTVISSLNKMLKNNAGYDLKQLFIGSEGTLGLITRAVLKLHPAPPPLTTVLCGVAHYANVVALLRRAQSQIGLMAFEGLWHDYHVFNGQALNVHPFADTHDFWVLLESVSPSHEVEAFLGASLEEGLIQDCVIATSEQQARAMWSVRDGHPIDLLPNIVNFDISVPIGQIGDFAAACGAALKTRWPACHAFFYGHIGDSNLHVSTSVDYAPGEDMHSVDDIVYGVLAQFNGSISAEHGIGTLKRPYLGQSRSPAELALMRSLKATLDPKGILNPGKVI